jgi:hypothetical protein
MPQGDTLTILSLGFAVFFGSLRLHASNRFTWILVIVGGVIIVGGCGKVIYDLWESHPFFKLLIAASGIPFGIMAWFLSCETYRSAYVKDYIRLWERNGKNWDNAEGKEIPLCLMGSIQCENYVPYVLRLSREQGPAKFTPIIQSLYDSLEKDVQIWITFNGDGLKFDDSQINQKKEWRPVNIDTTNGQRYWGTIDSPIYYGESKIGPDGVLQVSFPSGKHKVHYKIEGESRKGCAFSVSGYFEVEIY